MKSILRLILLCLLAAVAAGCSGDPVEPGIVAQVNGRNITLAQLEFMSDLMHLNQQTDYNPTLEQLKAEHGQALADLIVQQLVDQELEKRGMEVTQDEMTAAEEVVRADYPDGSFEETLVEEYIDINGWRAQLRARLAMEKLTNLVLRPRIKLDYQEAEKYYREHAQDFYLPPRLSLVMVTGPSRELVDRGVEAFQKGEQPEEISQRLNSLVVRRVKLREDRLPSTWKDALKTAGKDGVSPLWTDKSGVSRLIVVENIPGKLLDASQAYPAIERILLETKMASEFEQWLAAAVGKASIKVNAQFLHEQQDEAEGKAAANEQAPGEGQDGGGGEPDDGGAAARPEAVESPGKVRPAVTAVSPAKPAPDLGKAEEPKLTPDLAPQDVAPREIILQEKGRYYPIDGGDGETEVEPSRGKREKRKKDRQSE